jgi:uncharacterized protein (DUF58 family)
MFPSPEQESSERREKLLRELSHIEIYTRRVANQALVGDYRSSLRGEGVDFIEHKKYVAGDNWRRIDWNVLARTGQPYVKICYEEKEMLALIVADLSPSMDLGSEEFSKKDVLVEAVATIAFSAAAANMSVGLVGGAESVDLYLRPRKGRRQAWHILEGLLQYRSRSRRTNLEQLLTYAVDSLKRPCIFFVLSDFIVMESLGFGGWRRGPCESFPWQLSGLGSRHAKAAASRSTSIFATGCCSHDSRHRAIPTGSVDGVFPATKEE